MVLAPGSKASACSLALGLQAGSVRSRAAPAISAGSAQRPAGISAARKRRTLRVVVGAFVQRGAERAGGQGAGGDPGAGAARPARGAGELDHAPLLAAYPDRAAASARPSALARVTMRPYPAARIGAAAARQASQVPATPSSRAGPQVRDGELVHGAAGLNPGAGHQHVDPAVTGQDLLGQGADGGLAGDVAGPAVHGGPGPVSGVTEDERGGVTDDEHVRLDITGA